MVGTLVNVSSFVVNQKNEHRLVRITLRLVVLHDLHMVQCVALLGYDGSYKLMILCQLFMVFL